MRRVKIVLEMVVGASIVAAVLLAGVLVHPRAARAAGAVTFVPCGPWSNRSSPNPGTYTDQLFGVTAVSATDAWAVGWQANQASSPEYTLTEHWNGLSWSTVASANQSNAAYDTLQAVTAIASNDVWAVGYYYDNATNEAVTLAEHWNGTSWSIVPTLNPEPQSQFYSVSATATNDVWAVGGSYNRSTNASNTLIEHWNGSSWSVVSSPSPTGQDSLASVVAISTSDAWAVGEYSAIVPLAEHWNGSSWSVVPTPSTGAGESYLYSVSAAGANNVWAVGYQYISSSQPEVMLAEYWNGTSWAIMPNYNDGSNYVVLNAVAAIPGTQQVVAVGYDQVPGGNLQSLMLQWDGSTWSKIPVQAQNSLGNQLFGIAVIPAYSLWAVGSYIPSTASLRPAGALRRTPNGSRPGSHPGGPNAGPPQERILTVQEKAGQAASGCLM